MSPSKLQGSIYIRSHIIGAKACPYGSRIPHITALIAYFCCDMPIRRILIYSLNDEIRSIILRGIVIIIGVIRIAIVIGRGAIIGVVSIVGIAIIV